jgi:hypothetical protein
MFQVIYIYESMMSSGLSAPDVGESSRLFGDAVDSIVKGFVISIVP